jgi:hypothetical protein
MAGSRSIRRHARGTLGASLVGAALVVLVLVPSVAQTPYDVAEPPPSQPIGPAPDAESLPDPTALPLAPLPLPAPGPFGSATATVDGRTVPAVIRDPSARISPDDPVLALLPGVAVVGAGDRLLVPFGQLGPSREVAVRDLRIVTAPSFVLLLVVVDDVLQVREQLATGSLATVVNVGDSFVVVMGGLLPGTSARVTLFSEPTDLGTFRIDRDGVLNAVAPVPAGFPSGEHVLQVDAVRADRSLVSIAKLVDVTGPVTSPEPAVPAPDAATGPLAPVETAVRGPVANLLLALVLLVSVLVLWLRLLRRRREDAGEDAGEDVREVAGPPAVSPARMLTSEPPLAGEPMRLALLTVSAAIVVGVWSLVGEAALTRPRVESILALLLLQWVGLRVLAGPSLGSRPAGPPLVDVLGIAAGLTLGTGLHLTLDAFFDVVPLSTGAPGPHLPIPVTLGVLGVAVAALGAHAVLRSRRRAPDLAAARGRRRP